MADKKHFTDEKKLGLISELKLIAPKVYDMTTTFDMGSEFGAICSKGIIYPKIGMLLSTDTMGNFPEFFYNNEGDIIINKITKNNKNSLNRKLDNYLCKMIDVEYYDLELNDLFALLYDDLLSNNIVTEDYYDMLWENYSTKSFFTKLRNFFKKIR